MQSAEIRNHTGGRRKNAYVYIEVAATEWRNLAKWLKKSKGVDHCSMITGIHWPENSEATWQVVVHLMRTGVYNPKVVDKRVHETKVDIARLSVKHTPLEFEISMTLPETRTPSVPSVADIWVGANWNEKKLGIWSALISKATRECAVCSCRTTLLRVIIRFKNNTSCAITTSMKCTMMRKDLVASLKIQGG